MIYYRNVAKPVTGRATNNVGEIQAACEAIRIAKRCKVPKLCLNTDSQFLINAVTSWMPSWKQNNWKLQKGGMVKNVEDFKVLDELIKDSTLEIRWVSVVLSVYEYMISFLIFILL